jgi:hypothetical protein
MSVKHVGMRIASPGVTLLFFSALFKRRIPKAAGV